MKHMKQRLILFSALLIMSLSLGVASAAEDNLIINITHNGTDDFFKPGDVVNITADFNRTIGAATISIVNTNDVEILNTSMTLLDPEEFESKMIGNNFSYLYTIPGNISENGPFDVNISGFNSTFVDNKSISDFLKYDPALDPEAKLNITIAHNGTDDFFKPGDVVNITADFNRTISAANISITNTTDVEILNTSMTLLDPEDFESKIVGNNFSYLYTIPGNMSNISPLNVKISGFNDTIFVDNKSVSDFLKYDSAGELDPETDSNINVTYSKTNVIPGDVVKITADFNITVANATILVTNNSGLSKVNESMDPLETADNSFVYNYTVPMDIISGPFGVDINASNATGALLLNGEPAKDPDAFMFNVSGYLDIFVTHNGTDNLRPGDFINITANFSRPIDHANISISDGLPGVSNANLVGADLVTDYPMDEIDDDTFAYDYQIPDNINGPLDIDVSGFDDLGNLLGDESFPDDIDVGDPYITIISPDSEFAGKKCVDFNFTAYDSYGQSGSQLTYTFYLNGIQKSNGVITSGQYKQFEFELADGNYTWEIKTRDSNGNTYTSGSRSLYVDTKCPSVKLISPLDCYKEVIGATQFNFTCEDALAAQYSDLDLSYQLYIDGELAENFSENYGDEFSGDVKSGKYVVKELALDDGLHNWSVSVEDGAGNKVTSEVRKFYVSLDGFTVSLVSPNGGYVPSNPKFTFEVAGKNGEGAGLPFHYKLLIDGKEVDASCDQADENLVCCTDEDCGCGGLVIGEDNYSITAAVKDGENKNWTVIITDCTSSRTYQPNSYSFSVDSIAPACVANLNVVDAPGSTSWYSMIDYPGLMVSWNASTDKDLADMPYEVYISTSKPSCIEDMQKVNTTGLETHTDGEPTPNQALENSSVTELCIEAIDGKDIVYGKDYWVAVIARDNASNYNSAFSMRGPVHTYEDMDITLEEGWNLKSVPKKLVAANACPEDVFGNDSTVIYWDGSCWQFPETIEPCKGYWVYTEEPLTTNVQFKGMSSDGTNPDVPASLVLTPGWHMIGHTSANAANWSMTLASLNDFDSVLAQDYRFSNLITYSQGEGWGGIIPGIEIDPSTGQDLSENGPWPVEALQSYGYMVPGQGYWIFMKNEGTYASIENVYNPYLIYN